jgi:cytidyltransferase-like protein
MSERVVQCHGCFDLLHIGHIRHFEAAKQHGDRLVVTVTPDAFVNKGPGRPRFTAPVRAEAIRALRCVDDVQITDAPTAADAIRQIRPSVFAKGPDYAGWLHPSEREAIADVGAELVITDTEKWSSSALLRESSLNPAAQAYLARIREQYTVADVRGWLDRARKLRVLVVGDAIRDEYHYVDTLGKSGKDPILAARFVKGESFQGGASAVAAHVQAVSDDVHLVMGPRLTVKRRFIEQYPFQKLFEVYEAVDQGGELTLPDLRAYDLVVVADYGHGALTHASIAQLTDKARCLAVNVQANAGNHGFNTISKYRRAEFLSISERELRLDARDETSPVTRLAAQARQQHSATVLVTRGSQGCLAIGADGVRESPAFTTHVVDHTGAGDAVFAVAACGVAVGMPLDLVTFLASVVGTQAVGIVGNARYIEREALDAALAGYLG